MASRFVPRVFNQVCPSFFSRSRITDTPDSWLRLAGRYPPPDPAGGPRWYVASQLTHTGKYASAAFVSALTRGEKNLAKLESDLKYFNDVLKSGSQDATKLRTFLTNPTVSAEARSKTISDLLSSQKGGADELTRCVQSV